MSRIWAVAAALLALSACGGVNNPPPLEACEAARRQTCQRFVQCDSQTTAAACLEQLDRLDGSCETQVGYQLQACGDPAQIADAHAACGVRAQIDSCESMCHGGGCERFCLFSCRP